MRWPLRNQVFVPFAILLTLTVIIVTIVNAWNSVRLQRQREFDRMKSVAVSLGDANFPLTTEIITRVSGMVGGDVVVVDEAGAITGSTLPEDERLAEELGQLATSERDSFETRSIEWNSSEYLVGAIKLSNANRLGTLYVLTQRTRFDAVIRNSVVPPLLVAIPTLLLGLLLAMLISRRIGGRVERLQSHFQTLAAGEFNAVEVDGRNDEIRDLLRSANELSERLKRMQGELVRVERLELLGQLSGGLAHQLRNSITGARLAVQMHEKHCDDDRSGMLDTALAQLKLTEEQVLAVLTLRPSEQAGTEQELIDPAEIVREVVELLRPQTAHWKTQVSVDTPDEPAPWPFASRSSIKGALLNVGLNAVQAAGAGGQIWLTCRTQGTGSEKTLIMEVQDSGPGFAEQADDLTEAFRTTKPGGFGIGLTIARHAVQQESGTMEVSRSDDRTSVKFVIPDQQIGGKPFDSSGQSNV